MVEGHFVATYAQAYLLPDPVNHWLASLMATSVYGRSAPCPSEHVPNSTACLVFPRANVHPAHAAHAGVLSTAVADEPQDPVVAQSAFMLYGMIHARFIVTARGLEAMVSHWDCTAGIFIVFSFFLISFFPFIRLCPSFLSPSLS